MYEMRKNKQILDILNRLLVLCPFIFLSAQADSSEVKCDV